VIGEIPKESVGLTSHFEVKRLVAAKKRPRDPSCIEIPDKKGFSLFAVQRGSIQSVHRLQFESRTGQAPFAFYGQNATEQETGGSPSLER